MGLHSMKKGKNKLFKKILTIKIIIQGWLAFEICHNINVAPCWPFNFFIFDFEIGSKKLISFYTISKTILKFHILFKSNDHVKLAQIRVFQSH